MSARRTLMMASVAAGLVWFGAAIPVRINWTGSAPFGVYSMQRASAVTTNDQVVVCLQGSAAALGRARGYLPAGTCPSGASPILKQVVAIAGDEIKLQSNSFEVNGRVVDRSRRRSVDSVGRSIDALPFGRRVVRDGEVWVLGVHRTRSWDSRYFGPIPASSIVATARPLLTVFAETTP